jgi:hypothetical protein
LCWELWCIDGDVVDVKGQPEGARKGDVAGKAGRSRTSALTSDCDDACPAQMIEEVRAAHTFPNPRQLKIILKSPFS